MKTTITPNDFTRAKNLDVNGNPRYIIHFLHLNKEGDAAPHDISGKYAAAVSRANKLGGKNTITSNTAGVSFSSLTP